MNDTLPPLPEPTGDYVVPFYTADQMRDYARAALAARPAVPQWRKIGASQWWDGHPDHEDGGGPYESRTLYTHAAPTPPAPDCED